jgi:hypothetical protein
MAAIRDAEYHWFSHGHPDHLNSGSLPALTKGQFLLSDHYGSRIQRDLVAAGYSVRVLPIANGSGYQRGSASTPLPTEIRIRCC